MMNPDLRRKSDALAAAIKEIGLSHLPPPRPHSGKSGTSFPPAIDMRLRPRSGGLGRLPVGGSSASMDPQMGGGRSSGGGGGDGAEGDGDLEGDFEARLQRNIEMSLPPGMAHTQGAPRGGGTAAMMASSTGRSGSGRLQAAQLAAAQRQAIALLAVSQQAVETPPKLMPLML